MASLNDSRVDAGRLDIIRRFYATSDEESSTDEYAAFFTEEVSFHMGPAICQGREEVRQYRPSMWTHIKRRKHKVNNLYLGAEPNELMLYGTVDYELRKSGAKVDNVSWAGRMVFSNDDNSLLQLYHVWFDPTVLKEAIAQQA